LGSSIEMAGHPYNSAALYRAACDCRCFQIFTDKYCMSDVLFFCKHSPLQRRRHNQESNRSSSDGKLFYVVASWFKKVGGAERHSKFTKEFRQTGAYFQQRLIVPYNFSQHESFSPIFCIFGPKFSDSTIQYDFPTAQNLGVWQLIASPASGYDATKIKYFVYILVADVCHSGVP